MRILTPNHTVKSSKYIITFQIGKIPAPSCLNHLPSSPHGCKVIKLSLTMSMSSASAVGLFSWVSLSIFAMRSFKTARLLWLLLLLLKFFDGAFKFVDASFFGACFLLPHPFHSCDGCRVIFFVFLSFHLRVMIGRRSFCIRWCVHVHVQQKFFKMKAFCEVALCCIPSPMGFACFVFVIPLEGFGAWNFLFLLFQVYVGVLFFLNSLLCSADGGVAHQLTKAQWAEMATE